MLTVLLILVCSAAWAAGGGGHADSGVVLKDFLWRCLNFAALVALLAYFVTKPIKRGLAGRTESIEKSLADAREAQKEAEAKFAEYDEKLAKASAEIDDIYASIKAEGENERDRIIKDAREMAAKMEKEAQKTADVEVAKAKAQLQDRAVHLAIEIAEDILKKNFTTEDHSRLVDEYMQKVGDLH
nr:F0F1 ATP synthase subunit B [Desulfuromonadales bacterium]